MSIRMTMSIVEVEAFHQYFQSEFEICFCLSPHGIITPTNDTFLDVSNWCDSAKNYVCYCECNFSIEVISTLLILRIFFYETKKIPAKIRN